MAYRSFGKFWQASTPATIRRPFRPRHPFPGIALRAINNAAGSNHGELVYPQYPGLVVAAGEVRSMTWGFPLAQRSKKTGQPLKSRPVNNARTDKLDSFMWRYSFSERRCLIPADAWAEAEGERGAMTRTWLSLPDRETFAIAGIWRDSDEWGTGLFDGDDGCQRGVCRSP